jgi:hypothetical protein
VHGVEIYHWIMSPSQRLSIFTRFIEDDQATRALTAMAACPVVGRAVFLQQLVNRMAAWLPTLLRRNGGDS